MSAGGANSSGGGAWLVRMVALVLIVVGAAIALDDSGFVANWWARLSGETDAPEARPATEKGEDFDDIFSARPSTPPEDIPRPAQLRAPAGDPEHGAEISPRTDTDPAPDPSVSVTEKTDLERDYLKLFQDFIDILPHPQVGKVYRIRVQDGGEVRGELKAVRPGRILVETKYGSVALPIDAIHPDDIKRFFPRREAQNRALEVLAFRRKQAAREDTPAELPSQDEGAPAPSSTAGAPPPPPPSETGTAALAGTNSRAAAPLSFDPKPEKSDPSIRPLTRAFAEWLEVQHRRIGGRVARKAFAHRHGDRAVLYLVMDPQFLAQPYDVQFQFAESLWQFWAFRARDFGAVRSLDDAYIVFLDSQRRRIGGSRREVGSDVWVKAGKQTTTARR